VHPGALGLADVGLHDVDERGDVVVGDLLALVDLSHGEGGPLTDRARRVRRHHPEGGPGLHGQDLDLEPHGESGLVGEEAGDGRE